MKVALVHDWFVGGGAEKVVAELHKMFPDAPIFTSYCSPYWKNQLDDAQFVTGYLQRWPFSKLRKLLGPLRALWFSHLCFDDFDLVISSSGAEAKGLKVNKPTLHIDYCHAPTHYYWSRYEEYMQHPGFGWLDPLARLGLKALVGPMRRWDKQAAQRPDYIIANSSYIKDQIKKYYGRDSEVINPPVEIDKFKPNAKVARSGFLVAGRQTPYKRFDLAVAACSQLDLPLKVVGGGPDNRRLRKMAGPTVSFVSPPKTTEAMAEHFQQASAFIFPGIDDFGIVAVEALAAGTPLIAYGKGGVQDYLTPQNGLSFGQPDSGSLASVLASFDPGKFNFSQVSTSADRFSPGIFRQKIKQFIDSKIN